MVHPETPRLLEWLRDRGSEMAEFALELTRHESPSTEPEAQEPVFRLIADALAEEGYRIRRLSGDRTGGQLLARPGRRNRVGTMQLLVGHVDTVWPVGTVDRMPVEERNGHLVGPGIFDMKGGLAQMVFALRALRALELEPAITPLVFVNSDEEIGSPESEGRIRRLARRACRALVMEPALEPAGKLKTTRRGIGRFTVRVRGKSAHTGLAPGEGASAILELSHVVQRLHALSDVDRGITVNVGEIRGGSRPNVVAAEAQAEVDVRVRTVEDGRWLEGEILSLSGAPTSISGTSVGITGAVDRPPMEGTPRNRALWHAANQVARALGLQVDEGMSGGASDGNTTSLFTATLDGLGAVGDGAHALHEYVEMDRMPERAALLAGILLLPRTDQERGASGGAVGPKTGGGP
jgi:glutamate carboxypeptidase